MRLGKRADEVNKKDETQVTENVGGQDLTKLKKRELLEIMLAQGREIDELRARVEELEAQLENREFDFEKIGSLAEASVYVSNLFREADNVAKTYLLNIKKKYE